MKKQMHAPETEQRWLIIKPGAPPKIGPDKIARNAVPGTANDWKLYTD